MRNSQVWPVQVGGTRVKISADVWPNGLGTGQHTVEVWLGKKLVKRVVLSECEGATIPVDVNGRRLWIEIEDKPRHLVSLVIP